MIDENLTRYYLYIIFLLKKRKYIDVASINIRKVKSKTKTKNYKGKTKLDKYKLIPFIIAHMILIIYFII